jgi:hypothetical protein
LDFPELQTRRTKVFQLIGSTNPLITSAISSALTLARPMVVGSRFMQVSQLEHWDTIAGAMCCVLQRLFWN